MNEKQFRRWFRDTTRLTMTVLLVACLYIAREVADFALSPSHAMEGFHSFPFMTEHVLTGAVLYLAFAVVVTKFRFSSLHDGTGTGIN